MTGTIPERFDGLQRLQDLHLYENQLQGSLPLSLANLPDLQHVKLADNDETLCLPTELIAWAANRAIYEPPPGGVCDQEQVKGK